VADAAIFTGIVIILIRQKAFFPASRNSQNNEAPIQDDNQSLESFEQSEIEDDTLS